MKAVWILNLLRQIISDSRDTEHSVVPKLHYFYKIKHCNVFVIHYSVKIIKTLNNRIFGELFDNFIVDGDCSWNISSKIQSTRNATQKDTEHSDKIKR